MKKPDSKTITIVRMTRLAARLATHLDKELDRLASPFGLTSAQFRVLAVLRQEENGLTVSDIARRLNTSRQSVQQLVNSLFEIDALASADNPSHKKAVLVLMTEAGRDRLIKVFQAYTGWANESFKDVPEAEFSDLADRIEATFKLKEE